MVLDIIGSTLLQKMEFFFVSSFITTECLSALKTNMKKIPNTSSTFNAPKHNPRILSIKAGITNFTIFDTTRAIKCTKIKIKKKRMMNVTISTVSVPPSFWAISGENLIAAQPPAIIATIDAISLIKPFLSPRKPNHANGIKTKMSIQFIFLKLMKCL